ncbi:MAG: aminoacyl-tRNA hydrolase [Bacteroidota bacterium]
MKYLIAGLGNPGMQYRNTRHNIGFMAVDELAARKDTEFEQDRLGYTCTVKHRGRQIILLKPVTFMNLSGKAVRFHLQKHKIPIQNLLVVTDDIVLPFGKFRIRKKGSHGGHNGLRDVEAMLGTNAYPRFRFGVGDDFPKGAQVHYVLADFPQSDMTALDAEFLPRMADAILAFAGFGIDRAMNDFNG